MYLECSCKYSLQDFMMEGMGQEGKSEGWGDGSVG